MPRGSVSPRGGGGTYYPSDRYYGGYYWGSPWTWGGLGFGYYFYNPYYYWPYSGYYGYGYPYSGYGYPYSGRYTGYGEYYGDGYYYGGGYPGRNTEEPMGGVRLKIKPNTASVYVDGYYAGRVDDFDNIFQKLPLSLGTHRIEVTAPGFRPLIFDLMVRDWDTMTYEAWLEPMGR